VALARWVSIVTMTTRIGVCSTFADTVAEPTAEATAMGFPQIL
jgi:hypothetical protein